MKRTNKPKTQYPTLEPGLYKLARQVANPFPKKTKWLSSIPIFPPGEYTCIAIASKYFARLGIVGRSIFTKGQRGFITCTSTAAFEAISRRLEYVGPVPGRPIKTAPKKRGPKRKLPEFPIDAFLDSITGKELSSAGLRFAAQDYAITIFSKLTRWQIYGKGSGVLDRLKSRMEYDEWSETWTYKNK